MGFELHYLHPCARCRSKAYCDPMKRELPAALERLRWIEDASGRRGPDVILTVTCASWDVTGLDTEKQKE